MRSSKYHGEWCTLYRPDSVQAKQIGGEKLVTVRSEGKSVGCSSGLPPLVSPSSRIEDSMHVCSGFLRAFWDLE